MRIHWRSKVFTAVLSGLLALVGVVTTAGPSGAQSDEPPTAQIGASSTKAVFDGPAELAGTAFDDNGVAKVGIAIRNASGQWLKADGTFGSFVRHDATLDAPGATSTGWTFIVDLPEGAYGLSVTAFDSAGQRSELSPWTTFAVRASDDAAPTVTMNELEGGRLRDEGSITVTGTASDATGVDAVSVWVYDTDDCDAEGIDLDNCSLHKLPTRLADPGARQTSWSLTFDVPDGQWRAEVRRARDVLGNSIIDPGVGIPFAVGASVDGAPPVVQFDSTLDGAVFRSSRTVRFGVGVSDDVLPVGLFLALRNLTTGEFLQANDQFRPGANLLGFDLPREGFYLLRLSLEPGQYQVWTRGLDHAWNLSVGTLTAQFEVVP